MHYIAQGKFKILITEAENCIFFPLLTGQWETAANLWPARNKRVAQESWSAVGIRILFFNT